LLTYQIDVHSPPTYRGKHYKEKPKFVNGSEDHRRYLLERNYNAVKDAPEFQPGQEYTAKGHDGMGVIIDVTDDFELVCWEGFKVLFIEMWFYEEQKSAMFHPSDLVKRKGRK
jgi:hypothetical protein